MASVRREVSINQPLSPQECVDTVLRQIHKLLDIGLCVPCAVKLVSAEYEVDLDRLMALWMESDVSD